MLAILTDKNIRDAVEFAREIKDSTGQMRDFGVVSKEFPRGADALLVEAVENFVEYPSLDVVTLADDEHWVLLAIESKETSYVPFEEAKQRISLMLEKDSLEM